ncbi:hypothetical protein NHQ30_000878 [Ciborinia camelliae]|nr:hypothetical protein NHQ30_000878 [Ciborinia camelliae]
MPLLHLPPELVESILLESVFDRSIRRALSLRLVCQRFSQEVGDLLFKWQLLDNETEDVGITPERGLQWHHGNYYKSSEFWRSYLVYRAFNIDARPDGRVKAHKTVNYIHRVAESICKETGADLETTIEALCGLRERNFDQSLLSAATYLNHAPMVRRLLQDGNCFQEEGGLFPSSMGLAADCFQEHLPESEGSDEDFIRYTSKEVFKFHVTEEAIQGAAIRGDKELLYMLIFPANGTDPEITGLPDQIFGPMTCNTTRALRLSLRATYKIEVYKYLRDLTSDERISKVSMLGENCRIGNIEMVRFLLDSGVDIRAYSGDDTRTYSYSAPLVEACRKGHEDLVDLLLERGADADCMFNDFSGREGEWKWFGGNDHQKMETPINIAAKAGSLSIVRKLIGHGTDLRRLENGYEALRYAVENEHTEMVKLLLASGVDLGYWGQKIFSSAHEKGLDSMVELLELEYFKLPVIKRAQWMMVGNGTISYKVGADCMVEPLKPLRKSLFANTPASTSKIAG